MNNGNRVGSGNGGFHSYRRFPQPTPARSVSPATEMSQAIGANADGSECTIWEQDQFMPIANVVRIMRRILPPHTKISDDSKVTIQECITAFISFVTSEASDRCQREQRKTITAEDLLWAMNTLGLYDYIELLTLYLHRYREFDGGERGSLRGEPLVLKRPTVDPPSGCNIMPYHQPPNFPMVDPPSSCNIMPYHLPPNFPMVDPPSSCNIMPYHLPPNFPMAPHHGYFVYPPPMGNGYMQGDASSVITSHCAVAAVDSDVESPAEKSKE